MARLPLARVTLTRNPLLHRSYSVGPEIAYNNHGMVHEMKGEINEAEADFAKAKKLGFKPPRQ